MEPILIEQGLTAVKVLESRRTKGANIADHGDQSIIGRTLLGIIKEPMFLLLLVTCIIYFVMGQMQDGFIMMAAILIVSGISVYQDYRSSNAVRALNKLAAPRAKVIRESAVVSIPSEDIVVGDVLILEEGIIIQADGELLISNDLTVNQSTLTGESFAVAKSPASDKVIFKGTLVTSGGGKALVTAVGVQTKFGMIGKSLQEVTPQKTPLQQQIHDFVRKMVIAGIVVFLIVVGFNFYQLGNFNQAFLQGLTLAMSILPEEIPVAFSTFQALGAFRLLKRNVIVKQPQHVETLGAATVICVDKTGTLTQNKMEIVYLYDAAEQVSTAMNTKEPLPPALVEYAMWSSETTPFDPMEKAIHSLYEKTAPVDLRTQYQQIHEYPLGGNPPMMTHIFKNAQGEVVIATKGAPEAVLQHSNLTAEKRAVYLEQSNVYARKGYRVLGVGKAIWENEQWPINQEDFVFSFLGFVVFEDPIKPSITQTIQTFKQAGIAVKMITGDYAATAIAIAEQAGMNTSGQVLTGKEVMDMTEAELKQKAMAISLFVRMFPEAKLKVINALKASGEVVAMTGDGVNDAPALKSAHIGVAMGRRGSEVAKNAASLILVDDDLSHMTDAIALGRKIYDNLKKAIQYIISIHIPIILIVTLPLLLMWKISAVFFPVHVIFLELIMGPTCSIIYENEPVEEGTMTRPPRKLVVTFLSFRQLLVSIVQGLAITIGCLGIGYYYLQIGEAETTVRTVIFITLLFCNIFLTQLNRSFVYSVFNTILYKNVLVPVIIMLTLVFIATLLYVPVVRDLFRLHSLSVGMLVTCLLVAMVSTCWLELVKWNTRSKRKVTVNALFTK